MQDTFTFEEDICITSLTLTWLLFSIEEPLMDKIEEVQKNLSNLIPEIRHIYYCERLNRLNLLQFRRFYKKILIRLIPNVSLEVHCKDDTRPGIKLDVSTRKSRSNIRSKSFQGRCQEIFNCLHQG